MNEETDSSRPITLVMVHGVGDAKHGAILADFCDALQQLDLNPAFREENWRIGKFPYARLAGDGVRFGGRTIKEMTEVNWADVLRPADGKVGILKHLVMLFYSLRNLSLAPHANPSAWARRWTALYWFTVELVCLWVSFAMLGVMMLVSSGTAGWAAFGISAGVAAALGGIAWLGVRTKRPRYRWGYLWALGFLGIGTTYSLDPDTWRSGLLLASGKTYAGSQVLWAVTLYLAFFSSVFLGGGSLSSRAARGGYLWLSFVLVTSLLVTFWLAALESARWMPDYDLWDSSVTRSLNYRLKPAEQAMMAAQVFTFVGVPLFGLAVYFSSRLRRMLRFPKHPGPAAHQMVEVFLIAGPCALLAATAFIFWKCLGPAEPTKNYVLESYQWSALRIPALLGLLLPGIRVIADIVGDVLFHVQPEGSEVSSRRATGQRLGLLLAELKKRETGHPVVILAHSQGSVISWTLLDRHPSFAETFVSVGSPLTTLYRRFFGGDYPDSYSLELKWHNLYRDGDYVGGEVKGCQGNRDIGPGVNTGYWNDPVFAKHFSDCLMGTSSEKRP